MSSPARKLSVGRYSDSSNRQLIIFPQGYQLGRKLKSTRHICCIQGSNCWISVSGVHATALQSPLLFRLVHCYLDQPPRTSTKTRMSSDKRQHQSRSSNVFPSKACASSGHRSLAKYSFAAASLSTASFLFSYDKFTTSSTSEITHLQAWTPFSPNLAALVDSTHFWMKLSGTQISFEVATEMLSSSGSSPAMHNAIVLGALLCRRLSKTEWN